MSVEKLRVGSSHPGLGINIMIWALGLGFRAYGLGFRALSVVLEFGFGEGA